MALRISPCRSLCDWRPSRRTTTAPRLFACAGCGSQWEAAQPWAPRQADGSWPPGVREELAARDGVALTSDPRGAGAGTSGS